MTKRRLGQNAVIPYAKRQLLSYGAKAATNMASRWLVSKWNNTMNKKKITSGKGITTQYDRRSIYRKKYMSGRKKRRWVKFVKRVNAVSEKGLASRTVVFNNQITVGVQTSAQTYAIVHLYSFKGLNSGIAAEAPADDLQQIFSKDSNVAASKLHFKSAVLDVTFNGFPGDEITSDWPMEVDVYEVGYKKRTSPSSFHAFITAAENQAATMTGYSSVRLVDRGVTPFDLPQLARMGVVVLKKTKYFLSRGGSTFTYQIRDPKNRWISGANLDLEAAETEFVRGGWTRSLLFVIKNVPGGTVVDGAISTIGVTRKYCYTKNEANRTVDGYIP